MIDITDDRLVGFASEKLRGLTEKIARFAPDNLMGGFLGGRYGYGCEFKNDVFEMRPFSYADCACDEPDEQCAPSCPLYLNFACGDYALRWYKYIGRSMEHSRPIMMIDFATMIVKCEASLWIDASSPVAALTEGAR